MQMHVSVPLKSTYNHNARRAAPDTCLSEIELSAHDVVITSLYDISCMWRDDADKTYSSRTGPASSSTRGTSSAPRPAALCQTD